MENDNDLLIEDDFVKAIIFNGGIYGTTGVIVDVENLFGKRDSDINNLTIITGAQETHELCWREDLAEVTNS